MVSIGFIGGGRMAEALINGLISSGALKPEQVLFSDIDPERSGHISKKYGAKAASAAEIVRGSEAVVLAVKPQVVPDVIKGLSFSKEKLLISIAAGITIGFLEKAFPGVAVIRSMPNNPALVGAGITALARGEHVSDEQLALASRIFGSVGEVVMVKEKDMDAVTGLSGSGPAYVYLMIEALAEAGKKLGLDPATAEKLALETVSGAARTMKETKKSAKELREMVTSPGGTTLEGLKVLEKMRFAEALVEAVAAAAKKSKKLSQ